MIDKIKKHNVYRGLRRGFKQSKLNVIRYYCLAQYRGMFYPNEFKDLTTYCVFIGHGRSGHSIVGALLDAHENAIVADEIDTLRYLDAGFSKQQVFQILLAHSEKLTERQRTKFGRAGKIYSYAVPGQWQGRFSKLHVIGDSKAAQSARRLKQKPTLFDQLRKTIDSDIKFIHVIRNPYDNISTLAIRNYRDLEKAIEVYFSDCEAVKEISQNIQAGDLITVKHEQLIEQPEKTIRQLCDFIGLEPQSEYIRDCASIIYKNPAKSRTKVEWNAPSIQKVEKYMEKFDFLAGYSYAE